MYIICELKLFLDTKYSIKPTTTIMSSIDLRGEDMDMTESLVDQELGEGARSTTGVTEELRGAQLEVKRLLFMVEHH